MMLPEHKRMIEDVLMGRSNGCLLHGDCLEIMRRGMPSLLDVDHIITDPAYSEKVHKKQVRQLTTADKAATGKKVQAANLGFEHLTSAQRYESARLFSMIAQRWCIIFTDAEGQAGWKRDLEEWHLEHVRIGAWVKKQAQPQMSGDRPAVGFEAIEISHAMASVDGPRGLRYKPMKKRWNGGGHHAVWTYPIVKKDRIHKTEKPLDLALHLVAQFTDEDDVVLDPYAGSAVIGVACLALNRRYIGIELDPAAYGPARKRLQEVNEHLSHYSVMARTFLAENGIAQPKKVKAKKGAK